MFHEWLQVIKSLPAKDQASTIYIDFEMFHSMSWPVLQGIMLHTYLYGAYMNPICIFYTERHLQCLKTFATWLKLKDFSFIYASIHTTPQNEITWKEILR